MSNVKSWGIFLGGLNHAGKTGKVIKTIPDFSPDADPEMVKFNIALVNAKKYGHCVITRKNKDTGYLSDTYNDLEPFLNNDYVGVLTTKSGDIFISEFNKISSRAYVKDVECQPLEKVSSIEPIEHDVKKEYKDFNRALTAAATYQIIIKDKNGYNSEGKTGFDVLKKIIKYKYFGFFSKKPNLLEYVRFGYRKLSDDSEAPLIYGGNDYSNSGTSIGEFLKIETKIISEPKNIKSKNTFSKALMSIDDNGFGYIKRKSDSKAYECNFRSNTIFTNKIFPTKMIDSFMSSEYNAIVTKDTIYEYWRVDIRPIAHNMEVNDVLTEKLKHQGVWEGVKFETEDFNKVLDESIIFVRDKDGFRGDKLTQGQTEFIEKLIKEEFEYFAVRSTTNKLYEFILVDKRDRKTAEEEPVIYRK